MELYLVIIAASIPTLKPLVKREGGNTRGSSRQPHGGYIGYISTKTPTADHFSNLPSHSADDGSSQTIILQPIDGGEEQVIRKTVNVSVDYAH